MSLDENTKAFLAHISDFPGRMIIYLAKKIQIFFLLVDKLIILAEYLDFMNIYLKKLEKIFIQYIAVIKYVIMLKNCNQLFYELIYRLILIELKTFKNYFKTN